MAEIDAEAESSPYLVVNDNEWKSYTFSYKNTYKKQVAKIPMKNLKIGENILKLCNTPTFGAIYFLKELRLELP